MRLNTKSCFEFRPHIVWISICLRYLLPSAIRLEYLDVKNQSFNLLEDYKSQCQKGLKEIFEDSEKLEIASSYVTNIIEKGIK